MSLTAPSAPPSEVSRWRRMVPPAAVAGGLAAATLALHLRDPHDQNSWGICPTAAMGFACPGCGGLRAVNDLGNLQLGAAASSNLLFVLSLPFIAYAFLRWARGRWTGTPWEPSDRSLGRAGVLLAVAVVVFTTLRNFSAFAWLAP